MGLWISEISILKVEMVTGDGGRVGGGVHFQKKLLNLISILQGELETGKGGRVHFQRKIAQWQSRQTKVNWT